MGNSVIYAGGGNDQIFLGSGGLNKAYGEAGDDVFYTGGGGSDTMYGGVGNDQYVLYDVTGIVVEAGGGGFDTVWLGASGYTMAAEIEDGRLLGSATSLTGNAGNNNVVGNNAGLGSTLDGGAGDDILWGTAGNDVFKGGTGNDVVYSGAGADRFIFDTANWGNDQISDFSRADGDRLDMRGLGIGFSDLSLLSGTNTQVTYAGNTIYLFNVAGLTASDFIFV